MTASLSFVRRHLLASAAALAAASVLALPAHAQADKKQLVIGGTAGSNIDQLKQGIVPLLQRRATRSSWWSSTTTCSPTWRWPRARWMPTSSSTVSTCRSSRPTRSWTWWSWCKAPSPPGRVLQDPQDPGRGQGRRPRDPAQRPEQPGPRAGAAGAGRPDQGQARHRPVARVRKDLAENRRKLKFIPLEAAQLPRSLGDTEYAIINGNFAISSGLKLTEAVSLERPRPLPERRGHQEEGPGRGMGQGPGRGLPFGGVQGRGGQQVPGLCQAPTVSAVQAAT